MAQSLIACPVCSAASFSSTGALSAALVNVASKWLRCTLCKEELRGIDKFTIHILGHLINESGLKTNAGSMNSFVEPLNLVKPHFDKPQETSNTEMILGRITTTHSSERMEEDTTERFSLKVDDEVMIFFNSNNKSRPENQNNSESENQSLNFETDLSKTERIVDLSKFNFNLSNNLTGNKEQPCELQAIIKSVYPTSDLSHTSANNCTDYTRMDNNTHPDVHPNNISDGAASCRSNNFENKGNGKSSFLSPNGERVVGYRCDVCSLVFPDENILLMHRQLIHVELTDNTAEVKHFKCHLCSKSFVIKGSLMVHMRVAHFGGAVVARLVEAKQLENNAVSPDSAQFICPICNKGFKKEQQLAQHEAFHEGKQCDICLKTFTTKYFLRKHKRLHTGEMPYSCHVCNKSFTFQQSYHKHMLYHSDEKPHPCLDCGRAFKELSTLHNHQRIHTGEKPFSCDTCGKCFRQRVSYLVHRRIHTGVMPYRCQECGKTFRYKVSERTHKCSASSATTGSSGNTTIPSQEVASHSYPGLQTTECQELLDGSGTLMKELNLKDVQPVLPQSLEGYNGLPEPTDFFSLVMSPSDKLQQLTLSPEQQSVDDIRQVNMDSESLKQLLYDVVDYNN